MNGGNLNMAPAASSQPTESSYLGEIAAMASDATITDHRGGYFAEIPGVYVVRIDGTAMYPAFADRTLAAASRVMTPGVGDRAVVQLLQPDGQAGPLLVRHIADITVSHVELEQYNPPVTCRVAVRDIGHMHKVVTTNDVN
jgi:hypothetical protein